ncbi:transmembrane amino acid transporter protein-domain-containing protein [Hysterangium stoloniferum]|nr:transmembrane amino acid transporter protein-domain-containing protein [Hysterangium stoloniferum]
MTSPSQNPRATSPSVPVPIGNPRSPAVRDTPTPRGTPDFHHLTPQFGTPTIDIPPRGSFVQRSDTPPSGSFTPKNPLTRRGSTTPTVNPNILDELSDADKAKVVRRHLVSREERGEGSSSRPASALGDSAAIPVSDETFPIPYDVPGGDITHDIYKWQSSKDLRRVRSASFSGTQGNKHPAFEHIREPGGFRRNYLMLRAEDQDAAESGDGMRTNMLRNFIDFLYIFGHFAGEDLEEEEEEEEEELDEGDQAILRANTLENGLTLPTEIAFSAPIPTESLAVDFMEQTPLLKRAGSRSLSRRRSRRLSSAHGEQHGDATETQAVLMLLKGFIGTGVLFLGKAFFNGGMLFSAITVIFIAAISLWSFLLLVKTKFVVSGSFGDMGGALYGTSMRYAILSSIVVSQLGFTSAYLIFVASNLQAFIMAVTNCETMISTTRLIFAQLIVFLPLAMIRNLAKLSTTALIADACILVGLVYIFGNEFIVLASNGIADVKLFNPKDYALLIGTAVFSFEGIGLVIPITDSMREPHKFPRALTGVMIFLTVLFAGAGVLAYAAYGSKVETVVILNLPQDQKFVQVVQFLYSVAILLSIPLQLFPAVRIMENGIFTRSGKHSLRVKWQKNAFRFIVVLGCTLLSWLGAADLDKFVAFIGSFACVPLCYVYPPMLHYKACARTRTQKAADIALIVFGTVAAIFTTIQTLKLMLEPAPSSDPELGRCPTPPSGNLLASLSGF